jgi:hypothetical protein
VTKTETIDLQRELHKLGHYSGPIDGIYGPNTEQAYAEYWRMRHVEIQVPVVTPAPSRAWWLSRSVWGSLLTLVAVGAGFLGMGFDADVATDALMPIIETVPLILAALGAVISWWGRRNAKAPIDPTLMARVGTHDIRLPSRVRSDPLPTRSRPEHKDPRGLFGE